MRQTHVYVRVPRRLFDAARTAVDFIAGAFLGVLFVAAVAGLALTALTIITIFNLI